MTIAHAEESAGVMAPDLSSVTGAHRRALDAIFHHPTAHNLEWSQVVALIESLGKAHEQGNSHYVFEIAAHRLVLAKPHTKDLTGSEVREIRHFLLEAKVSAEPPSDPARHPHPAAPTLLVAVYPRGTKVFEVEIAADDPAKDTIRPYDPGHTLHNLAQKERPHESGQAAPEEPENFQAIATATALGAKIVIVADGTGVSHTARGLADYLKSHHGETYQRVVREIEADLSTATDRQLLDLARRALRF